MKKVIVIVLMLISIFSYGCEAIYNSELKDIDINFTKYFEGYKGCFILYDLDNDTYLKYNQAQADQRIAPMSTFKVFHSLVALQTGVLEDQNTIIKWDGYKYPIKSWNRDQTLASAVSHSVVWYFYQVYQRIGYERMDNYLQKVNYGNKIIVENDVPFWLNNSLKISANEQVDFMTKLYKEQLPFDKRVMEIVKKVIILEESNDVIFAGKTGSGRINKQIRVGWFIGYLQHKGKAYTFALNIEGQKDVGGWKAKEITESILKELNLF
jgi:beta-lactamase class D